VHKLLNPGRNIFASGIAALGILCMIVKDFIVGRPPAWPINFDINPILAYISGALLILSAIAIILKIRAAFAAFIIAGLIFLLTVLRHLPQFMNDWLNAYKSMAMLGGALIVAASFLNNDQVKVKKNLILAGCVLITVFFISSGYAHFKFADFVKDFIPAYIPFHVFWTYFCGICLIAGGIGILIPFTRKWAALLAAIMLSGWFIFLHIPRFLANTNDASDRMGLLESFTFAGILFVLAAVAAGKRRGNI
jgi:uncharacterized membrane protein YphA (DoxX/SURF4 family)